jgi:hypothetical protein
MPLYVEKAVLFGSFLTDKEKPGDVDLMVLLSRRYQDDLELQEMVRKHRTAIAWARGRNLYDAIYFNWCLDEANRFLKKRSPSLSIQPYHEEFLEDIPHKLLAVEEPRRLPASDLVPAGSTTMLYWGETATSARDQTLLLTMRVLRALEDAGALVWTRCRATATCVIEELVDMNRRTDSAPREAYFWTEQDQKNFDAGGCLTIRHFGASASSDLQRLEPIADWRSAIMSDLQAKGVPRSWMRFAKGCDAAIEIHPLPNSKNHPSQKGTAIHRSPEKA